MWAIVDTSGWGVAACHRGLDIVRKAQTSRARRIFAPLSAFMLVALSLVFVGVAAPASASSNCGSDAGWVKVDDDKGSISPEWGSLTWDGTDGNAGSKTTIDYTVNQGYTLELCIKASNNEHYSAPIVGAASGSFSTGDKYGISHIGYKIRITLPAQPTFNDPCGVDNATWNVPADTATITWSLVDGELIATAKDGYLFTDGTSVTNYGTAPDSDELCGPEEIEIPAAPSVTDPCGVGNATWNVPDDNATFDWELVGGELIVTILAENTVFEGTGETSHNFGEAVETNTDECEVAGEQLEIPAQPGIKDPCGAGNARWKVPADTDELDWTLDDGVLSVEILVADTVFEGTDDTTYSFGKAVETNKAACEIKGQQGNQDLTVEVKGAQATVPTAVDAGVAGVVQEAPLAAHRNPLWLVALGGGLGLMGFAGSRRRKTANR